MAATTGGTSGGPGLVPESAVGEAPKVAVDAGDSDMPSADVDAIALKSWAELQAATKPPSDTCEV